MLSTITVTPPVLDAQNIVLPVSSDVRGLYFTYMQTNGLAAAEQIQYWVRVDGVAYSGTNAAAVDSQVYYVYLDEDVDGVGSLLDSVNVVGMKNLFPWYAQSMEVAVIHEILVPAGSSLTGSVRYEQL